MPRTLTSGCRWPRMSTPASELWRDLSGVWQYGPMTRDACAKVVLTEADRRYLDKYPKRIERFVWKR